jgi:hypothetical protein
MGLSRAHHLLLRPSLAFFVSLVMLGGAACAETPLLDQLTEKGISLAGGQVLKAAPVTLADGLSAAEQRAAIEKVAAKKNYSFERFTKDSSVAPFVLEMASIKNAAGQRTGQTADLWFIAYGSIAALKDQKLLDELSEGKGSDNPNMEMRELTAEELKARGIVIKPRPEASEAYQYFNMPLLDRVQLEGVSRAIKTETDESVLITSVLIEGKADDAQLGTVWRPLQRDDLGRLKPGDPSAYSAYGGYAKITQLKEPAGALFIELHVVFEEPQGWFRGANLLRSKMPISLQDSIRKFRPKLSKVTEQLAAKE